MIADLLADIAAAPDLHDAACRGQSELFDAACGYNREAIHQAQQVCLNCPVFDRCWDWVASLPPLQRPNGVVVAGRYWPVYSA